MSSSPPALPPHRLHVLAEEESPDPRRGFLQLHRVSLSVEGPDGARSDPMPYDHVTRRQMDAAVMVAHCLQANVRHVYLRSALRPPLILRAELGMTGAIWELPAGLIDVGETPSAAAAREVGEELGFDCTAADMRPLGPRLSPVPAAMAELQYYFSLEVDPAKRRAPAEDGILERDGAVALVPLDEALDWIRAGELVDGKTEIGLRRLAEMTEMPEMTR